MMTDTFANVTTQIADARDTARREAKRAGWKVVWSRGLSLLAYNAGGSRCAPLRCEEPVEWNGTKRDLMAFLAECAATPECVRVYADGGFDGGDTVRDRMDDCYTPWVSSWDVKVWERGQ